MGLAIVLDLIPQLAEAVKHAEAEVLLATLLCAAVHIPVRAHVLPVPDHALKSKHKHGKREIGNHKEKQVKLKKKLDNLDNKMLKDWKDWRKGVFGIVSMVHTIFSLISK